MSIYKLDIDGDYYKLLIEDNVKCNLNVIDNYVDTKLEVIYKEDMNGYYTPRTIVTDDVIDEWKKILSVYNINVDKDVINNAMITPRYAKNINETLNKFMKNMFNKHFKIYDIDYLKDNTSMSFIGGEIIRFIAALYTYDNFKNTDNNLSHYTKYHNYIIKLNLCEDIIDDLDISEYIALNNKKRNKESRKYQLIHNNVTNAFIGGIYESNINNIENVLKFTNSVMFPEKNLINRKSTVDITFIRGIGVGIYIASLSIYFIGLLLYVAFFK